MQTTINPQVLAEISGIQVSRFLRLACVWFLANTEGLTRSVKSTLQARANFSAGGGGNGLSSDKLVEATEGAEAMAPVVNSILEQVQSPLQMTIERTPDSITFLFKRKDVLETPLHIDFDVYVIANVKLTTLD